VNAVKDHVDGCAMMQAASDGGNPHDFACTCNAPSVEPRKGRPVNEILERAYLVLSKIDPEERTVRHENVMFEIEEVLGERFQAKDRKGSVDG
jgi:hypothetical protein